MQNLITWPYILRRGHSKDPAQGACAMDAVNWLVHGQHGDAPECACPIITRYVIHGNDAMPDDVRQHLLPYLHRIAGSHSEVHRASRIRVLRLGILRVFTPRVLDAIGLFNHATRFRNLPDDVDISTEVEIIRTTATQAGATMGTTAAAKVASIAVAAEDIVADKAVSAVIRWGDYFIVLEQMLNTGPQGEAWSVDMINVGRTLFEVSSRHA